MLVVGKVLLVFGVSLVQVKYSGELFAVKKTAFRWREVLIMPKLRHKNVLKVWYIGVKAWLAELDVDK